MKILEIAIRIHCAKVAGYYANPNPSTQFEDLDAKTSLQSARVLVREFLNPENDTRKSVVRLVENSNDK